MNPANEQRLIDTLAEARKHEGLEKGMVPWYVMDPLYQRMEKLVGPERAAKEYRDFNMSMTPFSAGSSVPSEINRGTAANMMRQRGEYDTFQKYGGLAANEARRRRLPGDPARRQRHDGPRQPGQPGAALHGDRQARLRRGPT